MKGIHSIDNMPDTVWKYVPTHELGHYFGLCHADGLDRIMYSPRAEGWWNKDKGAVTLRTIYSLIFFKGEPSFTLEEEMQTWDYIIEHFPANCLGSNAEPPVIG